VTAAVAVRHLRPPDLASRWGVSVKRLADDRSRGQGPAFLKVGGSIMYRLEDVETFERDCLVRPVG